MTLWRAEQLVEHVAEPCFKDIDLGPDSRRQPCFSCRQKGRQALAGSPAARRQPGGRPGGGRQRPSRQAKDVRSLLSRSCRCSDGARDVEFVGISRESDSRGIFRDTRNSQPNQPHTHGRRRALLSCRPQEVIRCTMIGVSPRPTAGRAGICTSLTDVNQNTEKRRKPSALRRH